MGANSSTQPRRLSEPQDIGTFRKHTGPPENLIIPEVPQKRRVTDFKFTVTFGVCILILVPFLIYTFVNSDLDRLVHGYDKCGNICGENNSQVDHIYCSGQNMVDRPFLRYVENSYRMNQDEYYVPDECVATCGSGYEAILNRCYPSDGRHSQDISTLLNDVTSDINRSAGSIVLLCFIGFGFSVGMLFLFKYFVAVVVWVILIGSIVGIIVLAGVFWYLKGTDPEGPWQVLAIFFTIISVILVIVLICMFKRIKMIIRLFKEAIKVIFGIPLILFEPLLTFVASTTLLVIFFVFLIVMSTAGSLQQVSSDLYEYSPNGAMLFTLWYHAIICIWMSQFIIGCQHMVVSGAVSAYYFARDKSTLSSPIYNSFYNLVRYHLGTVAFGSLIVTIITIIRELLKSLMNSKQAKVLIDCCLGSLEDFLKYLSKNAYIQTAMHGQPFYKSGKRAVRLLSANFLSAVAVNSVGDFILGMSKLLIVVCTAGIGILMHDSSITHFWAAILISVFVTAIIADCFFSVFETAIDTIFLCYCEDSCMNDGMERPYYMTVNLRQYVEDAKKTVKDKNNPSNQTV